MAVVNYDKAVAYYDRTRGYPAGVPEKIRDAIIDYTGARADTRFLELAIGTGLIGIPFIEAGYSYVGVDISTLMMQKINDKLDTSTTNRLPQLIQSNVMASLPFPDNTFDVINAVRVFHMLDNWKTTVTEAKRILKAGGYLLIAHDATRKQSGTPDQASIVHAKWDEILDGLGITLGSARPGLWRTKDTIIAYLHEQGATTLVKDFLPYNSLPFPIREIADRHRQRTYRRDWSLSDEIHAEAVKQLDHWLDHECDAPDIQTTLPLVFRAIVARWDL